MAGGFRNGLRARGNLQGGWAGGVPRGGEVEAARARDFGQAEHLTVELLGPLDVGDDHRDVLDALDGNSLAAHGCAAAGVSPAVAAGARLSTRRRMISVAHAGV